MSLTEIEFELSAEQYALLEYRKLQQGQSFTVTLDGGVLLPDLAATFWFAVQPEALTPAFQAVGPSIYAFAGRIEEAEIEYGREQLAHLSINCGSVFLRVTCAPGDDGQLPDGTWETRYIAGIAPVQGLFEENFELAVGRNIDVTLWGFRRLVLTPGDLNFGRWHESVELAPTPFTHDRVYVKARIHRQTV
ncbi:hypothetical protein GC175_24575 [bacterium]|nr:hypothetical protein [bacterium]